MQNDDLSYKQFLFVVLLALVASIAFQGSRGLYETTEGRYAEVAREMLRSGNYLEPTLLGLQLLSLVLFFMAKSKLQLYILPLFLPLSLIMGRALATFLDLNVIKKRSTIRILAISGCIFIVALKALSGTSLVSSPHDMKRLSASIDEAIAARSFQLLVVYDKKLNGLAFYRDEILDHINPGMSDQLSEKVIATFRNGKTPVVLLRAGNVDLVSDALRRSGISVTVKDLYGGWMLITCEQRS